MEEIFIRSYKAVWRTALAAGVAIFGLLAIVVPNRGGHAIDDAAAAWADSLRSDGWTSAMELFSRLGSTVVIAIAALAGALLFGLLAGWRRGLTLIGSVLAGYALNTLLKGWIGRPRPEDAWGIAADGASFPSGNAMLGIILYGLAAVWAAADKRLPGWLRVCCAAVPVAIVAGMGFSRLYFHVHYATDIAAGFAAGIAIIGAAMLAVGADERRRGQ